MTENLRTSIEACNQFFYFSMNYPHNFIQRVWKDEPMLTQHLQGKFDTMYEDKGSYGVMNDFYAELDGKNRIKLLEWVMTDWEGNFTTGLNKGVLFGTEED